ncbi:unnamed protein product [Brugia pahangi]|uniref:Secreted protein n=1 Tax=Brugia pahangi TaxID=6280 RepID=A0A0N4TZM5_BRUPA|nr:unnamed protein product [Brugia pahangi]
MARLRVLICGLFTQTPTAHVHRTEPVQIRESTSIEHKEVNDLNHQERKLLCITKKQGRYEQKSMFATNKYERIMLIQAIFCCFVASV